MQKFILKNTKSRQIDDHIIALDVIEYFYINTKSTMLITSRSATLSTVSMDFSSEYNYAFASYHRIVHLFSLSRTASNKPLHKQLRVTTLRGG